jgi:hypothetical protein
MGRRIADGAVIAIQRAVIQGMATLGNLLLLGY